MSIICKVVPLNPRNALYENDQKEIEEFQKKFGNLSTLPPNFKEISAEEFSRSIFFHYLPTHVSFKQTSMPMLSEPNISSIYLYHYHDGTGIAMVGDYWDKSVRYFSFAVCEHDRKELSQKECRELGIKHWGMCYHVYRCTRCGEITSVDSSG